MHPPCLRTLRIGAVRDQAPSIGRSAPSTETQPPPPAGSPKNHSPRRGPTILRHRCRGRFLGRLCHLPPCAPPEGRTAGARLRTLGAPLGTHTVGACCASASIKGASYLSTLRIIFVQDQARYSVFERVSAQSSKLRITGEANSGRAAAYFVSSARHSLGRRLLRLHAPNKRPSGLRTLRIRSMT